MVSELRSWKSSRPLWFRLPRLLRICLILSAVVLGPFQRRWSLAPHRIRALLIVRDLHSALPGMVETFLQQGILAKNIFLLDSGSTNPDCLSTLKTLEEIGCCLIRLSPQDQHFGPYAPWLSPTLRAKIRYWDYPYLVSDPDLVFTATIPGDWLAKLFAVLNMHRSVLKVALPLSIDDITVQNTAAIKAHEDGLYHQQAYRLLTRILLRKSSESTICATDTTLALYRPSKVFSTLSIRLPPQYSIKHLPWYVDFCSSHEYKYYQDHKLDLYGEWSSMHDPLADDHSIPALN